MIRIKRTKKPPPPAIGPAAVHYAATVAPYGQVSRWTSDPNEAGVFDDSVGAKVKAYYANRENAGKIDFEPFTPPKPVEPPANDPAADLAALRKEHQKLLVAHGELKADYEDAKGAVSVAEHRARDATQRADELAVKVADLETQLAGFDKQTAPETPPVPTPGKPGKQK